MRTVKASAGLTDLTHSPTLGSSYVVVLGVEALLAVIAGYFLYAEQLNARMLGGVALVVARTLLLRLP
jgi:multidrug transporter EmrE-like cation transporter